MPPPVGLGLSGTEMELFLHFTEKTMETLGENQGNTWRKPSQPMEKPTATLGENYGHPRRKLQ